MPGIRVYQHHIQGEFSLFSFRDFVQATQKVVLNNGLLVVFFSRFQVPQRTLTGQRMGHNINFFFMCDPISKIYLKKTDSV